MGRLTPALSRVGDPPQELTPGGHAEDGGVHALEDFGGGGVGEVAVALDHGEGFVAEDGGDFEGGGAVHGEVGGGCVARSWKRRLERLALLTASSQAVVMSAGWEP